MFRLLHAVFVLLASALSFACAWSGVWLLHVSFMWWYPVQWIAIVGSLLVMALSLVPLDSAIGYGRRALVGDKPIRTLYLEGLSDAPNVLHVILPGYNQDGGALAKVLDGIRATGAILTYWLPRDGFDQQAVVAAIHAEITRLRPDHIDVYAESAGGLDLMQLLRKYPDLHIRRLVLNAAMSGWRDANAGWAMQLARIPAGGPISTAVLQHLQRRAVANSPAIAPGADAAAAHAAEQNSLRITGAQAIGEIRRIVQTLSIRYGEFRGRVGVCMYLHAPGDADALVRVGQAAERWRAALGTGSFFEEVPAGWAPGSHAQTPENPVAVIAAVNGNMLV